jgi:hypothetical protein
MISFVLGQNYKTMLAKEDLQESNFSFFSVKNIKNHNTLCWLIDTLFRRHIEIQEHAKYDLQGKS